VVKRTKKKKGAYRQCSAEDPEATFRKHGDAPTTFGYNAAILTTRTRIRAVAVVTGAAPDNEVLDPLVTFMQQHDLPLPRYLEGDMAFGHGASRALVHRRTNGETTLVAKIPTAGGKDPNRFGPEQFLVLRDADGGLERCIKWTHCQAQPNRQFPSLIPKMNPIGNTR